MIPTLEEPRVRAWTKNEYYRMAELGWFRGQRAELIEGKIVVQSPQNWPHSVTTDRVADRLRRAFQSAWVRQQLPMDFGAKSEPEPDVSVVAGARADYSGHPSSAPLVVEVSGTTLWYDRGEKANFFAAQGVADYWIVDIRHCRLEVRRSPKADPAQVYGFTCTDLSVFDAGDDVTPLALPGVAIPVADFFG